MSAVHKTSTMASCEIRVATVSRAAISGTAEMSKMSASRAAAAPALLVRTIVVASLPFTAFSASTKSRDWPLKVSKFRLPLSIDNPEIFLLR